MTLRAIRSAGRKVVAPLGKSWIVIEAGHTAPRHAIVLTLEEPDRARTGKPDTRLRLRTRRQKEHMIQHEPLATRVIGGERRIGILFLHAKLGRLFGFLPGLTAIPGSINGWSEVPRANRREERATAPRILYDMMNLRAKKPGIAQSAIRLQGPGALACSQNPCVRSRGSHRLRHSSSFFKRLDLAAHE